MDRYLMKQRLKTFGYTLLWTAVILFTIRQGVLLWKSTQPAPAPQVQAAAVTQQVPDAATTVGKKFLIHWFYASSEESPTEKTKRLEKHISNRLEDQLKGESNLLITLKSEEKETIQANSVDVWKTEWVKEGEEAAITYNVILQDGRNVYLKIRMIKAGTWVVDGLPALMPEPERKKLASEEEVTLSEEKDIKAVVEGFFEAWLEGKSEAISRYIRTKEDIQTSDSLTKLHGEYQDVKIIGLTREPKVKAVVYISDAYGQTMAFEYHLKMEKVDGRWYITGME
ncbi:conjugal transfer protein [Desmospora activa]|uniref:Conjugative transposon protein TcpC n=1 Tax=Desmospora activa DSM 45169 TaxID=1121389 RepID=A0A2T4YZP0_9BACL|nr:conjugal transfer protein [Desmospora activa]PTM52712.1 conjugative transposon protein TcpC [Desmospora activa DSM 45169]